MQVVILCGGSGTRLREETEFRPKPMIHIGGMPMIVHILKLYAHYGFKEFVLALGYKQETIKEYFTHFDIINNDLSMEIGRHASEYRFHSKNDNGWKVTMIDTGENTFKGARLKRIEKYIQGDTFMMAYGDGIGDINLKELLSFHQSHGRLVTVTGVHPQPRFGDIHREGNAVISFSEKTPSDTHLINGGFYVFNRGIFDYLTTDEWCDLEIGPLELIANKGEMQVFEHKGYWHCLDTLKDLGELQQEWKSGKPRWTNR